MTEGDQTPPERAERGVADALRAAIERTLEATADSATGTRERAVELLDEVARRGRDARGEIGRQLEALEGRLASIEELLRRQGGAGTAQAPDSKPEVED